MANVEPKWRITDQFVLTSVHLALESDSLNSTKPMNYEQDYPGGGPPTYIAYQKAGSIIRMFQHFLTQKIFKKALTLYLAKHAFDFVEPPDLYQALQQSVNEENAGFLLGNLTVSSILETWDSQAGYPVVNVTRDYKTGHFSLYQKRFFLEDSPFKDNTTWYIPINYVFHSDNASDYSTTADFWMTEKSQTLIGSFPNTSWLIVNKQQTGYYRVNYDVTNWNRLVTFLNKDDINDIHLLNRAQLINDAFNLARAGQLHYHIALNLSMYLTKETDYLPLTSYFNNIEFLNTMLAAHEEYDTFRNYLNNLLVTVYKYLGFNAKVNDKHLDKLNRIDVLKWLCNVGNVECRNNSLDKIRLWKINGTNSIVPDLEAPIFCGAMRIGNQDDWHFLYQKYEFAGNTSQRNRILDGLGCSEDTDILNRFMAMVQNDNSTLRVDDRFLAFRAIYNAGNVGLNAAFNYIDEHFDKLSVKVNLPAMLGEIGAKFTTEVQLNELLTMANKHKGNSAAFETAIENAKKNLQWSSKYIHVVKSWLADY